MPKYQEAPKNPPWKDAELVLNNEGDISFNDDQIEITKGYQLKLKKDLYKTLNKNPYHPRVMFWATVQNDIGRIWMSIEFCWGLKLSKEERQPVIDEIAKFAVKHNGLHTPLDGEDMYNCALSSVEIDVTDLSIKERLKLAKKISIETEENELLTHNGGEFEVDCMGANNML